MEIPIGFVLLGMVVTGVIGAFLGGSVNKVGAGSGDIGAGLLGYFLFWSTLYPFSVRQLLREFNLVWGAADLEDSLLSP